MLLSEIMFFVLLIMIMAIIIIISYPNTFYIRLSDRAFRNFLNYLKNIENDRIDPDKAANLFRSPAAYIYDPAFRYRYLFRGLNKTQKLHVAEVVDRLNLQSFIEETIPYLRQNLEKYKSDPITHEGITCLLHAARKTLLTQSHDSTRMQYVLECWQEFDLSPADISIAVLGYINAHTQPWSEDDFVEFLKTKSYANSIEKAYQHLPPAFTVWPNFPQWNALVARALPNPHILDFDAVAAGDLPPGKLLSLAAKAYNTRDFTLAKIVLAYAQQDDARVLIGDYLYSRIALFVDEHERTHAAK